MTHYLDRRFRQVGRIKRAAGTEHKPTIRLLDQMLTGLYNRGRLDILRAIQRGEYTPLQVWEFYRLNEIEKLPTAATMSPLEESMSAWIEDKECAESHRASLRQSLRHLMSVGTKSATIEDVPELLARLRVKMKAAKHPQSFRLAKAAAQAFVKSKLTRAHPLYFKVMAVEGLKPKPQRAKHPLTVAEFWQLYERLPFPAKRIARTMALTGMGWTEYTGRWEVLSDRVRIHGTKRAGRDRFVPVLSALYFDAMNYKEFRLTLRDASNGQVTPYDLRRTFATWLEEAGIPRTRRKLYMGHGARDVTDLYERKEIEAFLSEDADRLGKLIDGPTETPLLKLEKA